MSDEVLLIGAGGLGCGAALALAAGGAQRLVVIDDDVVDESNLHRQILHEASAVGQPKAESLARSLRARFPAVEVTPVLGRFDAASAPRLLADCAVAIDGSDNLATKFLANDAAVLARKPLVHGAAVETWGQLLTVPAGGQPCYRCLFEELPPPDAEAPSCAEAGVLGPVPGVIGAMQAAEALRLLRAETPTLTGRLIRYDSRSMTLRAITFRRNRECGVCGDRPWITSLESNRGTQPDCAR
jgi:molybdopterin/thiamine biosynthesis adenylyltransferase